MKDLSLKTWFDWDLPLTNNSNVTVALTGQAITSAAGTLAPSNSVALTGSAITSAAGTLLASPAVVISGIAITSAAGTLAPSHSQALTGQAITSAAGTLSPALSTALTGGSATLTSGALAPSTDVPLLGGSVASASETLTASQGGDVTVALTGIQAVFAAGQIVASGGDVITPPVTAETPAGRNIRAYQYIIKIDGKEFVTPSLQQAVDLLNKAKDLARKHAMEIARAATEKAPKAPKIKPPKITGNAPVKELVLEVRKEIEAIYESALRDAEIAMLIELGKRRDEDEDTFLLML